MTFTSLCARRFTVASHACSKSFIGRVNPQKCVTHTYTPCLEVHHAHALMFTRARNAQLVLTGWQMHSKQMVSRYVPFTSTTG